MVNSSKFLLYVCILGSFCSSGFPYGFQKAFSVSFASPQSLLHAALPSSSPFHTTIRVSSLSFLPLNFFSLPWESSPPSWSFVSYLTSVVILNEMHIPKVQRLTSP